jgi:hypothetical protein
MNRVVGSQFDPSHGSAEPHEPPVSRAINALRSESHSPTLPQKVASGKRAYSDEVRKAYVAVPAMAMRAFVSGLPALKYFRLHP